MSNLPTSETPSCVVLYGYIKCLAKDAAQSHPKPSHYQNMCHTYWTLSSAVVVETSPAPFCEPSSHLLAVKVFPDAAMLPWSPSLLDPPSDL